jgi:hypothetical protein
MSNECQSPVTQGFSLDSDQPLRVKLHFGFDLTFATNHVRFMISPELYVVQENLTFEIFFNNSPLPPSLSEKDNLVQRRQKFECYPA